MALSDIRHPVRFSIKLLNKREYGGPNNDAEQRINRAKRTAAFAIDANLRRYYEQLGSVHEAIRDLGHSALSQEVEVATSDIEIIRPLRQDRLHNTVLGSMKYSTLNTGDGFTAYEYMHGEQGVGVSPRRFHVVQDAANEGLKGVALPYTMASKPNITKRLRVRPNGRPEDLAIALDGSGRTWAGVYVPHGVASAGAEHVPVFGVLEDPKTQPYGNNAIENYHRVKPGVTGANRVTTETHWLAGIEDKVRALHK